MLECFWLQNHQVCPFSLVSMGITRREATLPMYVEFVDVHITVPTMTSSEKSSCDEQGFPLCLIISLIHPCPTYHLYRTPLWWTLQRLHAEQCLSYPGNEMTKYLAWQPINEEIMCWTSLLIGECHQCQEGCVAVQLCREALLQEAPRQIFRGGREGWGLF